MTPKDTYQEHQKRMRKLLTPTPSLTQRFKGLRLQLPKLPLLNRSKRIK